jgi:hypothetical protein
MKHEELLKHIQQAVDTCFEYGLVPYKDGNQWCVLYGENIQGGIVGFGDTRLDAMLEFKKEYDSYVKRTHLYPVKEQPVEWRDLDSEIFAWQKAHANEDTAQVIAMTARHFAEWGAEHLKR